MMQFILPFVKPNTPSVDSQGNLPSPPPDPALNLDSDEDNNFDIQHNQTEPQNNQTDVQEKCKEAPTQTRDSESQRKRKKSELSEIDRHFIEFCNSRKKSRQMMILIKCSY